MAKIYNEIIIDMNPESSTFEETLYEDSFEGEIEMLAQVGSGGDTATMNDNVNYKHFWTTGSGSSLKKHESYSKPSDMSGKSNYRREKHYRVYKWNETVKNWEPTEEYSLPMDTHYANVSEGSAKRVEGGSTEWGAANISKDMFIAGGEHTSTSSPGEPRTIEEIYNTLDPLLPNLTGNALKLQIRDMLPKYTGALEEEKGFAREAFQKDVYGISKPGGIAEKAGAQMRGAYGSGMGASMRGAIGGMKDVSKQFKQAEQAYAKDLYGLEKKAGAEFETGIGDWMEGSWFETPESGIAQTTDFKQGGRVPNKKSFLEVLTELPDAGGS
jgi:hypothetical protein